MVSVFKTGLDVAVYCATGSRCKVLASPNLLTAVATRGSHTAIDPAYLGKLNFSVHGR